MARPMRPAACGIMPTMMLPAPCPCGQPTAYAACCGRWHDGPLQGLAPNAAALMRSRYSAFVLERADYLLATGHPSKRPAQLEFEPGLRWLGLTVQRCLQQNEDHASVHFIARSKLAGRASRWVETSRFVREAGRWWYVDADLAAP
jgi:SEC-C motif-containing protein